MKFFFCFLGKQQVFVCESLANLYLGNASQTERWELRFTGIPVVVLDLGETRSRSKRRIQILLAERGTCFTLWRETIDNLSSYKVNERTNERMNGIIGIKNLRLLLQYCVFRCRGRLSTRCVSRRITRASPVSVSTIQKPRTIFGST